MIPYNMLPIEMHVEMIKAENGNISVLTDAARMWTEVRGWIDAAQVELHTRVAELSPQWTDENGRAMEEKTQRTLAELKMWGERIDAAQPAAALNTLATSIPATAAAVAGFYSSYLAAIGIPFGLGAAAAAGFQQLSATAMNTLAAEFDMSIGQVVAASGVRNPAEVLPAQQVSAEGNSPTDVLKAATAGMTTLQELQDLSSSLTSGGSGGATGLDSSALGQNIPGWSADGGPSLAGLTSTVPPVNPGLPAGLPGAGLPPVSGAPVASGLGLLGAAGTGAGGLPMSKAAVSKRAAQSIAEGAPTAAGTNTGATAKPATGGGTPPMMPPASGHASPPGTLQPGAANQPTGRAGSSRKTAEGTEGVPAELRGRSGSGDQAFGRRQPKRPRTGESESTSVQLLDKELWHTT
ncbi:hypothetical protein [Amycolatopsis sp. WAC 01375]|uniref:hypothetical protein n=1 Tax=Amycolatopsis sp. WAC 01375 TaxID=2203194 RepID=UPI001F2327F4|nr:hypothetical protein [Amycolatopsis sp. WAC 01375]